MLVRPKRAALKDFALGVVRRAMVSGTVQPGQIFSATALATQLRISNSPVRDALLELVHGGILEVVPNRGFRVVELDQHDLDEVYELRDLLEVPAVGDLAEVGVGRFEDELRGYARDCSVAAAQADLQGFLDNDRAFHLTLLSLHGNGRLVSMVDGLRDQTRIHGMRTLAEGGLLVSSAEEHHLLLDAIVHHDATAARRIMRHHMSHGPTSHVPVGPSP